LTNMQPLKAHVRNGRLVLDEPTDLPEGKEVQLEGSMVQAKAAKLVEDDEVLGGLAAMLNRWEAEDVADEPDWDVEAVEPALKVIGGSEA